MHCNLATGGPGAAMRHAPFGRPRHPLGTFPCGKVPRPPAGGRNLSQETNSLRQAGNGPNFLFPHHKGFRLCGGDQGAFRSPPGPLRGPSLYAWAKPPTRNKLLAEGRKRPYLSFSRIAKDFASAEATKGLSGRPLETFGPLLRMGDSTRNRFLVAGRKKSLPGFFLFRGKFRLCGSDQGAFRSPPGPLRGSMR